jgi:hypothetical protein
MPYNEPMRLRKTRSFLLLALLAILPVFASCFSSGDSGDNQPLSVNPPIANLTQIFHSAPGTDGLVRVTGLAGSVAENGLVGILNFTIEESVSVTADATGAFQTSIAASVGDVLSVTVTSDGERDSFLFTSAVTDPVPLNVAQTDVGVDYGQNRAYVTVSGDTETSLVEIDLNQRQVSDTHRLTDAATGVFLNDLTAIEIFATARIAVVLERTQLKFYLVDLDTLTALSDPIALTDRFATIAGSNELSLRLSFNGVTESEAAIRNAISAAMAAFNDQITTTPDTDANVLVDADIQAATTQVIIAATFSGSGRLSRYTLQNSDFAILTESSSDFSGTELTALAVYNDGGKAAVGSTDTVTAIDLSTMTTLTTAGLSATPAEIVASGSDLFATLSSTHQVVQLSGESLSLLNTFTAGPSPTRLAIGSSAEIIAAVNTGDTTISLLTEE